MLLEDTVKFLPDTWTPMDVTAKRFEMVEVLPYTPEFIEITSEFQSSTNLGPLFRIQNPLLFTKFQMKCLEYETKGDFEIVKLFHDTVQANVESIVTYNIDWRYGERFKFGPGVYFSTSSFRARRRSNVELGPQRAMFLVDVLVGRTQIARPGEFLPDMGYDTIVSEDGETIVKYFDHEYYPSYVQYYVSY